jgi:dual specificity MAP kinase phosphatase
LSLPIRLPSIITQTQTHHLTPSTGSINSSVSPVSIFDSPVGTEESLSSVAPSDCQTHLSSSSAQPPQPPQSQSQPIQSQSSNTSDPYSPPLLTSTFRPKELLRRVRVERPDGDTSSQQRKWEFVPAKVPDGISLRNFGIQVVSVAFSLSFFVSLAWCLI